MSGGHFEYNQNRIGDICRSLEKVINSNDDKTLDEYGCPLGYGYNSKTIEKFKIGLKKLQEAEIYAQRIDWLLCGDDGEATFYERLSDELENLS